MLLTNLFWSLKLIVLKKIEEVRGLLKIYNTDIETNEFQEIREFKKGSWINLVNPSENEIKRYVRI